MSVERYLRLSKGVRTIIHVGDITKLNGHELPTVDVITGGSPCQDLSVAGGRAGLDGERSGLFMEQIRIIKEMRDESFRQLSMRGADVDVRLVRPRYMVWENVCGAFSSNKGEDFRCVLEETCRIADKTAYVPMPKGGKWSTSGCIMGDGGSVAWRVSPTTKANHYVRNPLRHNGFGNFIWVRVPYGSPIFIG